MTINTYTWDEYFMTMAYLVSMKSKDISTRVGAVIVGPDREIRSTGYNGLPRGIADKKYRYDNKDYKHLAVNHAEENAILHCSRVGVSTKGCTIYTPWTPCSRCAKAIIQSGITEVVFDENFPGNHIDNQSDWELSVTIAKELLNEAEIVYRPFSGRILRIEGFYKGVSYFPDSY